MSTPIEKLFALVPPPTKPVEVPGPDDWKKAERYLGAKLPADYKAFVGRYGSGTFADLYAVFNPSAASKSSNLVACFEDLGSLYDARHREDPVRFPHGIFPDKPGLIPWGGDSNGNRYFWLVGAKAKPDTWTVVWDAGGEGLEEGKYGFADYLLGVLEGRIEPLASGYPKPADLKFEPSSLEDAAVNPGDELCAAITKKDAKRVRELLDAGTSPDARGGDPERGSTPLGCALRANAAPLVRLLLERGADARALDNGYEPLLSVAADSGDPALVKLILDAESDPNDRGTAVTTPLFVAVNRRAHAVVELLLYAGADPNAPGSERGLPPLFQAIWYGDEEMVGVLLKHGARPNVKDAEGRNAAAYARAEGRPAIERMLKRMRPKK